MMPAVLLTQITSLRLRTGDLPLIIVPFLKLFLLPAAIAMGDPVAELEFPILFLALPLLRLPSMSPVMFDAIHALPPGSRVMLSAVDTLAILEEIRRLPLVLVMIVPLLRLFTLLAALAVFDPVSEIDLLKGPPLLAMVAVSILLLGAGMSGTGTTPIPSCLPLVPALPLVSISLPVDTTTELPSPSRVTIIVDAATGIDTIQDAETLLDRSVSILSTNNSSESQSCS